MTDEEPVAVEIAEDSPEELQKQLEALLESNAHKQQFMGMTYGQVLNPSDTLRIRLEYLIGAILDPVTRTKLELMVQTTVSTMNDTALAQLKEAKEKQEEEQRKAALLQGLTPPQSGPVPQGFLH